MTPIAPSPLSSFTETRTNPKVLIPPVMLKLEALQVMEPSRHAMRGVSSSLLAATLLSNALGNRRALFARRPQLSALQLVKPTRNTIAIAVFVGVFRFMERVKRRHQEAESTRIKQAALAASIAGILCVDPSNRTPILSLLGTNAVSLWLRAWLTKHPEFSILKASGLLVFMASSGWIFYSALFHPASYEPSHMKMIKRYSLTPDAAATHLQNAYAQAINASTCDARHPGQVCSDFLWRSLIPQAIAMGVRIYLPVHLTTWLLGLRRSDTRRQSFRQVLTKFVVKLMRSTLYYVVYILVGWTSTCYTQQLGDLSLTARKAQFLICGSLPAMSLLIETPSRRRPIGVILCSYAFVSMGTVVSQQPGWQWLKQGSGPIRSTLDVACMVLAVSYTFESMFQGNGTIKRFLFGPARSSPPSTTNKSIPIPVEDNEEAVTHPVEALELK